MALTGGKRAHRLQTQVAQTPIADGIVRKKRKPTPATILENFLSRSYQRTKERYDHLKDYHILPFCVIAILSETMEDTKKNAILNMFDAFRHEGSRDNPLFADAFVAERLTGDDFILCQQAFAVDDNFTLPSFYITIKNTDGTYNGNLIDWTSKYNTIEIDVFRQEMINLMYLAAHHQSQVWIEKGYRPWWKDKIAEGHVLAKSSMADTIELSSDRDIEQKRKEMIAQYEKLKGANLLVVEDKKYDVLFVTACRCTDTPSVARKESRYQIHEAVSTERGGRTH